MSRPPTWFACLLRVLPRRFRHAHAEEITEAAMFYARGRGPAGRAWVWVHAALDVLAVALAARLGLRRLPTRRRVDCAPEWQALPQGFAQDVRFALRVLRRDARFALFVVLIVGLGVGASVTVFSVARAVLLRPLPFVAPEELVWISNGERQRGQYLSAISVQVAYVNRLRDDADQLVDAAGYHLFDGLGDRQLDYGGEPERVTRLRVTANIFAVLGLEPAHGRLFTDEEATDDGPPAVLLTEGFFRRRFAGDTGIVGQTVQIDGVPTTVVGVLPSAFDFQAIFAPGHRIDYVAPFPLSARSNSSGNTLGLIARLAPGATLATATAEARAIAANTEGERLNEFEPVFYALRDRVSGAYRPAIAVLAGAVALVMLIVCANLSNLLLARGATRTHELAIRAAIGASRRRLVGQMLTESMLLSLAGSALGVALAYLGVAALARTDLRVPLIVAARVDAPALAVALAAAFAAGVAFGVGPAVRGAGVRLHETLKEAGRGASEGRRAGMFRAALVVCEVALSCVLMVGAVLLLRSFVAVLDVDLGYRPERVVSIRIDPSRRFPSDGERVAYYAAILDRVRSAPGIIEAGLSDILPMGFNRRWGTGDDAFPDSESSSPYVRLVSEGYAETMGLSLVAGRALASHDDAEGLPVALVNQALAEELWPGADPIGRTLRTNGGRPYEVIGVNASTRQLSVEQESGAELFLSLRQVRHRGSVYLVMRGDLPLEGLVAVARTEIRGIDPGLPLDRVVSIGDIVDASIAPRRFLVGLLTAFAVFALVLATLGIYGVISYSVARRRREIGIRFALGASPARIRSRIVGQTGALTVVGLVLGLLAAVASARSLESLLYGIAAVDPTTYMAVVVVLGGVAVAAGYVPARRASRANPLDSLSAERGGTAR